MSAPSTLAAIGARIAMLAAEEQGPRPAPDHGKEKGDLTDAGLGLPVTTLTDAAVLCDLAFGHADRFLASVKTMEDAQDTIRTLRRVVVCVGRAICTTTGLNPETVAWGDLGSALAADVVGGVAK